MSKFELGERVMVLNHTIVGEVIKREILFVPSGKSCYYTVRSGDFGELWIPEEKLIREGTPIEDLEEENRELKKENDKLMEYIRKLLDKLWVK